MKYLIIIVLAYGVHSTTIAQESWVLTNEGDTLTGSFGIISKKPHEADELIIKTDSEKMRLSPLDIRRAQRKDDLFVPMKVNSKYQFVKVVSDGYVSICKYIYPESKAHEDFSMTLLVKKDGGQVTVSNMGFVKTMMRFLGECPSVQTRNKDKKLKLRNLQEIVAEYNQWVDAKSLSNLSTYSSAKPKSTKSGIQKFINSIAQHKELANNTDLLEMLDDISEKLAEDEKIPGYLQTAVLTHLNGYDDFIKAFDEALSE